MTIDNIIAINGKPGLYQIVSAGKNNVIVESLQDKKRFPVLAINNISSMDTIAIYTYTEEIPLTDVFYTMYEKHEGKEAVSHKENGKVLKDYFLEVLPEYDEERVYVSNIKKVLQWYNILVAKGFDFKTLNPEDRKDESGEE